MRKDKQSLSTRQGGMSKLIILSTVAVLVAVGVGIGSLILNIIILGKVKNNSNSSPSPPATTPTPTLPPVVNACPTTGFVSNSTAYQAAAAYLLNGMDETIDPCEDFYAFTCNKFLQNTDLTKMGLPRYGTYLQSQVIVDQLIVDSLNKINVSDTTISMTERITKMAMDACVIDSELASPTDHSKAIATEIRAWFGGIPYFGEKLAANVDIFAAAGQIEQTHAVGTLISSWVSVDYKNVAQNALYSAQPALSLPRDYYVLPQFVQKLNDRASDVNFMLTAFAKAQGQNMSNIDTVAASNAVVQFEVMIAMASWPDDLLRNYEQQYNPYNLASLQKAYPAIGWNSYLSGLAAGIQDTASMAKNTVVLSQPSYFAWLNSVFDGKTVDPNTIVNYIITQLLFDDADFLGNIFQKIARDADYVQYAMRRGKGVTRIGRREHRFIPSEDDKNGDSINCIDLIMAYMPYGPGYTYVKAVGSDRDKVAADVQKQTELIISNFQGMIGTLQWMTNASKQAAADKSAQLKKNYGWPKDMFQDFVNFTNVDAYNSVDYGAILTTDVNDYYTIMKILKTGLEKTEAMRLLTKPADRLLFLQSPALVNAWYQPERNSITFPYAAWNPPYYNFDYPQAYNYAGQGGTGGHELTHGYDDEGVQFGPDGLLTNCAWNKCGWMDSTSSAGFVDMAQCVVTQFSTQCCPEKTGNVHCANGATTQGENIADLGGQQSAYRAYRQYIANLGHEEDRLPGLTNYTPNQIFWITYGYSWCMKQTDANLVNQLLTNPHSPAECRTNNVMQDIPEFGQDFGCRRGSAMYPLPQNRCKVWVGV